MALDSTVDFYSKIVGPEETERCRKNAEDTISEMEAAGHNLGELRRRKFIEYLVDAYNLRMFSGG
jgi:hypothetical protein